MPSCTTPSREPGYGPSALTPFFWTVTHQIARNHRVRGLWESWKIVPAVTEA